MPNYDANTRKLLMLTASGENPTTDWFFILAEFDTPESRQKLAYRIATAVAKKNTFIALPDKPLNTEQLQARALIRYATTAPTRIQPVVAGLPDHALRNIILALLAFWTRASRVAATATIAQEATRGPLTPEQARASVFGRPSAYRGSDGPEAA